MLELTKIKVIIANDIISIVRSVMESDVGINSKTGTNTLKDSDLYRQLKTIARGDGDLVFDIMVNDYIQYIESGRKAGSKWPPVEPIVKWMKKKGIQTTNSNIFLIRRSIAVNGIRPRKIFDTVFEIADKRFEERWSDKIFDEITKILDEYFK